MAASHPLQPFAATATSTPMNEGQLNQMFWVFAAAVGGFVLLLPNAFIYLVSYGGRLAYTPSPLIVTVVRACAGLMLLGALAELLA